MTYNYEETHQKIKANAKKMFLEKGFKGSNLREICKASGVTNGAFYKHFKSKEMLFGEIVTPCINDLKKMYLNASEQSIDVATEDILISMTIGNETAIQFIHYIYSNIDVFNLLIFKSLGTKYETFIEEIVELSISETIKLLESLQSSNSKKHMVSKRSLHMLTHAYFSAIFESIKHDYTLEETLEEVNTLVAFFNAGWMKILAGKEDCVEE